MTLSLQTKSVDLKEYTLAVYKESAAWLRDYVTAIKNGQLHPYTKLERKAREATRNEPWCVSHHIDLFMVHQACWRAFGFCAAVPQPAVAMPHAHFKLSTYDSHSHILRTHCNGMLWLQQASL